MPAISLPLSFTNSFWSQDYRRGLEILYSKLEQGVAENAEIVTFIRARVVAEYGIGASLTNPSPIGPKSQGFGADDGASLLMAFRGLQAESATQGEVHKAVGRELETAVAHPFEDWAGEHAGRITESKRLILDGWLRSYEQIYAEVAKLKSAYLNKTRKADEAEDDAKFAPNSDLGETYTTSPRLSQFGASVKRGPTVSQRISDRLRERLGSPVNNAPLPPLPTSDTETEKSVETVTEKKLDKGKGKEVDSSAVTPEGSSDFVFINTKSTKPSSETSAILLAGLALTPEAVSTLLSRAHDKLAVRTVKLPILGAYDDCFTGEEFVHWLRDNVEGFDGSEDRAESAAIELTERDGLLRRVGELGNKFENSSEAYFQFRTKAFELHEKPAEDSLISPVDVTPVAKSIIRRSNSIASYIVKTLGTSNSTEPLHIRARADADAAEKSYRVGVRKLDRQRLQVEEKIEETLKALQKWETDRLRAVKTVLLQYQTTLTKFPNNLQKSFERSSVFISSYQPESDLVALIERYRTGTFRPKPQIYESLAHEDTDVVFGIDLRKWASSGGEGVPMVVKGLLDGLKESYAKLPNDAERRKAWIYEVPLPVVHHLHEALNDVPLDSPVPPELLARYDAPVLANGLKLWLLELDPPIGLWEGWDEVRKIYPAVGADVSEERPVVEEINTALSRLPRVHLLVLDAVVGHLKELIDTTNVEEPKEVYTTKVALSMGRTILRPKVETELSIQDRHPSLLFADLIKHYDEILPPTLAKRKRESDRRVPTRKRTAPVDLRLNRRSIQQASADPHKLLEAQFTLQHPRSRPQSPPDTEVKPGEPAISPTPPELVEFAESAIQVTDEPVTTSPSSHPEVIPAEAEAAIDVITPPVATEISPSPPPEPSLPPVDVQSATLPLKSTSPTRGVKLEETIISGPPSIQRTTSGEARGFRGPRLAARGPRAPAGAAGTTAPATSAPRLGHLSSRSGSGSGSSLLDRRRPASPASPANPSDYAPRKHAGHAQAGIFAKRDLATRTMASGSEDETVGKKEPDHPTP